MNDLFIEKFNGDEIHNFIWNSKPCWIATEIGELLDYAEPSKAVVSCVDKEEFRIGKDYDILKGEELKLFKSVASEALGSSFKYAPRIIIFYEQGLYGFLQYTEKPLGVTFRTWIREEVVPQIRATGVYVLDDDYYDKTYNSEIEFTCGNPYSESVKDGKSINSEFTVKNNKLSIVDGKYIEVDKLNNNSDKNDFDIDKFQRLRIVTESAKLLKGLLDDVDTDSICKLAVIKTLFSIYFTHPVFYAPRGLNEIEKRFLHSFLCFKTYINGI
ncbi:MAG: BRO family protein [Sarcina sp.]